jgi:hypothetical protein
MLRIHPERRQREAFHDDLHAEVGHVPPAVGDHVLQQALQMAVQRVDELHLLVEVAAVDLDVAGFVDHLRGGIELAVDVGNGLHDLRGADECTLLAVHELAEPPGFEVPAHVAPLRVGHLLPPR